MTFFILTSLGIDAKNKVFEIGFYISTILWVVLTIIVIAMCIRLKKNKRIRYVNLSSSLGLLLYY